ncbi:PA14 domain-containing protein [Streptomyces sp. Ru72]|uniref:PA14 domain-containing protein n=1 Tax=Streptomyces sp. Ru72 TaxID=2080747 RepID=UPI000CDD6805|nr:PA14 domain-containing protein [Streptomyces sp. Ru72]POX53833.1 hypothetical protein C3488_03820 [Streptomyces sp. Ru72]
MNPARRRTTAAAATAVVLATAGGLLTALTTPASAATTCTSPVFKRQLFANTSLSGTPKKTDCDSTVNENWGTGAPASGLPRDNFSVRWTLIRDFGSGGPFTFTAATQDGIRVYLDGTRKVDVWKNVSTTQKKTVNVTIPSGRHTLRVDYVNWTGTANVSFSYTPRTSATVDKVRPLTPTGTSVSYDQTTGKAKVAWAKNNEMDLAGYRVYRRLKGASFGSTPLVTTTATSYTDSTLPVNGATYYYEVRAYDKAGNESAGTADQAVTTIDKTPPAAPFVELDGCWTDDTVAGLELVTTPQNLADIALYEAQRQDPATGAWTTVYTGTKATFCDPGRSADGTRATYRGRARDAAGNWSAYSAATTVTLGDRVPPAAPVGAHVQYRSGVPHLVWTADADAARYEVLQYDPATGGWLKAFGDSATTTQTDVVPRQQVALADEYRYAVRATDTAGNTSAPAEITLKMAERPEAIAPYRLGATLHWGGFIELDWRSSDPWTLDLAHSTTYEIVRTDTVTGESTVIDRCSPSDGDGPLEPPTTQTSNPWEGVDPAYAVWGNYAVEAMCRDASGASETTYEYRIVAIDPYGHRSQPSEPITATTPDTRFPAAVNDLKAEVVPLGVRLTWTPPADDDVEGYSVWQGTTDPDTGRTVWSRNCWTGASLPETEILCPTLPDGREHVYRVTAGGGEYMDITPDSGNPTDITVTLPDTRPPGWTGTTITEGQYPEIYARCGVTIYDMPCGDWTDYRYERWDPASGTWTTLASGKVDAPKSYMDHTVYVDRLGLYFYRAVYSDAAGNEEVVRQEAYGIWDSWL